MRRRVALLLLLLLCAAATVPRGPARADQLWTTTGDALLGEMRGGFALPGGLMVSFGIVRTVLVDGQVVTRTALQIPDVRAMTVDQAQQLGSQAAGLAVVQTGAGNTFQLPQSAALPGMVIQNTQNNRHLQALTEITVTTNPLRLLQGMNFNQAVGDALQGGMR